MLRLDDKGEGTFELLEKKFDKLCKREVRVMSRVINVFEEDGSRLSVRLALKLVATVLEDKAEGGSIGDDTVVHNGEVAVGIGAQRVAVHD